MNNQNDGFTPNDSGTSNPYDGSNLGSQSPDSPYQENGYQQQEQYNQQQGFDNQPDYGCQQSFNSQQDYNYAPFSQNGYSTYNTAETTATIKRKKSKKWLWGFSAIPALAIAAVLCFFFIPSFQNFVYKKFLGTTKYYEHVESSCTEIVKDELSSLPKPKKHDFKNGVTGTGKLTLDLDSSVSDQIGMDLSGFTLDFNGTTKDKKSFLSYTIGYKGTELGTIELCSDPSNNQIYMRIPTLSEQYIDYNSLLQIYGQEDFSDITSKLKNLSTQTAVSSDSSLQQEIIQNAVQKLAAELDADTVSELSRDYIKYILDDIGDKGAIQLEEKKDYQVGSITKKCDVFVITLTPKQFIEVVTDVLNKAKTDKKLLEIAESVLGNTDTYTKAIDSALNKLAQTEMPSDGASNFRMKVYTNGDQIFGRQFSITSNGECAAIVDYGMLTSKNVTTFNVSVTPTDASQQIALTLEGAKDGDKSKGTITLASGDQSIDIDFSDYKINDNGNVDGKFKTTVQSICNITLDFSTNGDFQNVKMGCNVLGKELGNISLDYDLKDATDFSYPSISPDQAVKLTDNKSLAEYLKNSKLESFIQTIADTFKLPMPTDAKTMADALISEIESGESFDLFDITNNDASDINNETDFTPTGDGTY